MYWLLLVLLNELLFFFLTKKQIFQKRYFYIFCQSIPLGWFNFPAVVSSMSCSVTFRPPHAWAAETASLSMGRPPLSCVPGVHIVFLQAHSFPLWEWRGVGLPGAHLSEARPQDRLSTGPPLITPHTRSDREVSCWNPGKRVPLAVMLFSEVPDKKQLCYLSVSWHAVTDNGRHLSSRMMDLGLLM